MRQQMLRDIKILSEAHDVPGLLSFLGAYLVPEREQVGRQEAAAHIIEVEHTTKETYTVHGVVSS
jgi:hypothetical protein